MVSYLNMHIPNMHIPMGMLQNEQFQTQLHRIFTLKNQEIEINPATLNDHLIGTKPAPPLEAQYPFSQSTTDIQKRRHKSPNVKQKARKIKSEKSHQPAVKNATKKGKIDEKNEKIVLKPEKNDKNPEKIDDKSGKTNSEDKPAKIPKCSRCRYHGVTTVLKGHKEYCKWKDCICKKCQLVVGRQIIMKEQVRLRRRDAIKEARKLDPDAPFREGEIELDSDLEEEATLQRVRSDSNFSNKKMPHQMGTASNGGCSCSCGFSQEAILRLLQENTCLIQRINALTETLEIPKFIGVIDAQNQSLDLVVALLKPYPTLANLLETQAENVFSVLPNVAKRQDGGAKAIFSIYENNQAKIKRILDKVATVEVPEVLVEIRRYVKVFEEKASKQFELLQAPPTPPASLNGSNYQCFPIIEVQPSFQHFLPPSYLLTPNSELNEKPSLPLGNFPPTHTEMIYDNVPHVLDLTTSKGETTPKTKQTKNLPNNDKLQSCATKFMQEYTVKSKGFGIDSILAKKNFPYNFNNFPFATK